MNIQLPSFNPNITWKAISLCSGLALLPSGIFVSKVMHARKQIHETQHTSTVTEPKFCRECKLELREHNAYYLVIALMCAVSLAAFVSSTTWGMGKWAVSWINSPSN